MPTDFEVFNEMACEGLDIRSCPHTLGVESTKKVSKVSMQVDYDTAQLVAKQMAYGNQTHYVVLYVVNKTEFDKIKNKKPTKRKQL